MKKFRPENHCFGDNTKIEQQRRAPPQRTQVLEWRGGDSVKHIQSLVYFCANFLSLKRQLFCMGTIQGKLRQSYAVKERPVIRTPCQYGMEPMNTWSSQKCLSHHQSTSPSPKKLSRKGTIDSSIDDIFEVDNVRDYPFCAIGLVSYQIGKHTRYGTGFLISKNVVLTSASNLYCIEKKEESQNVCFIPTPLNRREKQKLKAFQSFYPKQYKEIHKGTSIRDPLGAQFDYGAIVLDSEVNLQDSSGFLGVDFKEKDFDQDIIKSIIAYSSSEDKEIKLYRCENKVSFSKGLLNYPSPAELNLFGGPIMEIIDGECFVIGIHTFQKDEVGKGILFTEKIYSQLSQWLKVEEEEIDLRDKDLGKAGVKELVKYKSSFHVVNLSRNGLGTHGLKHFPRAEWTNLHHLDLGGNQIGKEGVQFLIRARIPNLKVLNLWGNNLANEGMPVLVQGQWSRLQILNLYHNEIGFEGLEILIKKQWPLLHSLNIGKNNLDKSAIVLLKKSKWRHLICLNLWGNSIKESKQITDEMSEHFREIKFLYV